MSEKILPRIIANATFALLILWALILVLFILTNYTDILGLKSADIIQNVTTEQPSRATSSKTTSTAQIQSQKDRSLQEILDNARKDEYPNYPPLEFAKYSDDLKPNYKYIVISWFDILLNYDKLKTDKYHKLPDNFVPLNLEDLDIKTENSKMQLIPPAKADLEKMITQAELEGIFIKVNSAYRSIEDQAKLYEEQIPDDTQIRSQYIAKISQTTALPGFSEHNLGTAVDLICGQCSSENMYAENLKVWEWLEERANKYNFYLSYPKDNKEGFSYEPWHWNWRLE